MSLEGRFQQFRSKTTPSPLNGRMRPLIWLTLLSSFLLFGGRQMLMSVQRQLEMLACGAIDLTRQVPFMRLPDRKNQRLEPVRSVRRQFVDQVVICDFVRDVATHDCRKSDTTVHDGNIDIRIARRETDDW